MPTQDSPVQSNLVYGLGVKIRESDLIFVKRLLREVQEDLESRKKKIFPLVMRFLIAYDMIRNYEENFILLGDPDQDDKTFISSCASILKGFGLQMLEIIHNNNDIDIEDPLGLKVDDLEAIVDELNQLDFSFSNDMTDIRKEEIKKVLCGD